MKKALAPAAAGSSLEHSLSNVSNNTTSNDNTSLMQDIGEVLYSSNPTGCQRPSTNAGGKLDGTEAKRPSERPISQKGNSTITRGLEDCVPSRQGEVPFLLTKGPISREESQYTTREEVEPERLARGGRVSHPGAFAVVPSGDREGSSNSSESDEPSEPNDETLVTAIKVSSGTEVDVDEVVRIAREEAELLRQQVKALQREKKAKDTVVFATAVADNEEMNEDQHDGGTNSWRKMVRPIMVVPCIVLILFVVVTIVAVRASQADEVAPTSVTTAPTPAPTLYPCLEEIFMDVDDVFKNETSTLGLCQGDCNSDGDCAEGLICHHRSGAYAPVPGCSCWDTDDSRNDYCINPQSDPCLVETFDFPLGLCEGNCEDDDDCQEGFSCYDASLYSTWESSNKSLLEVPGCQWCPTQTYEEDDWFSNEIIGTNAPVVNKTATSKFCVQSEECVGCILGAPTADDASGFATASGSAICLQYSLVLLSLSITLFGCAI